jgi:hypothetical protein
MSSLKTRSASSHSVFGSPLPELPLTELPTRLQVGRYFLSLKDSKYSCNKDTVPQVSQTLIDLWTRAGIPSQPLKNVKLKVSRLMDEAAQASKQGQKAVKTVNFMETLHQLFDIAACQCEDLGACKCDRDMKVPQRERQFLMDQRTTRKMHIDTIDRKVTAIMKRKQAREDWMKEREDEESRRKRASEDIASPAEVSAVLQAESESASCSTSVKEADAANDDDDYGNDDNDDDYDDDDDVDDWTDAFQQQNRNMVPIPTIALEADRYGVSNRAAAAISTATLVDYGIISLEDQINIVDPHKVWRARLQLRRAIRATPINNEQEIMAIFFDGRKDMTLMREKRGDKWYSTKKNEEHYVMIGEPGTFYLCHLTLEQGTGSAIADSIHNAIEERGITDKIMAVGADSTAVNTGHRGGAIHLLELHTGRPLQWFICSLHLNELPFRHLCKTLIGATEGPTLWKGPIGKALATCASLPLSAEGFRLITDGDPLPEIDVSELSNDQAYLYKMITAIRSGSISDDLLQEKPGPMSMARWLTTASRICRLYVATVQPSNELYSLTHFIVCCYGPTWFNIKCRPRCTDGPKHLLQQIKQQSLLSSTCRNITWPVVQRNAYWAHQENVLLSMLGDDDDDNRKAAVDIIKTIRQAAGGSHQQVREFRPPKIKENAQTLQDLLPSMEELTLEPPLTKHLSDEELQQLLTQPFISQIPCHSQGVERCVRTVSEASKSVYGMDARDGYIRAVIKSRNFMPSFQTKQDFRLPRD